MDFRINLLGLTLPPTVNTPLYPGQYRRSDMSSTERKALRKKRKAERQRKKRK